MFVDFGDKFISYDPKGQETIEYSVSKIEFLEDNKIGIELFTESIKFEKGD